MIKAAIEVSARHVHLTVTDWKKLFGRQQISVARKISQHPQFAARQRVTLVGPHDRMERVGIVGPFRRYSQIELSRTDARRLGVRPPVTFSGNHSGAARLTVVGPKGRVRVAAIVQQRHVHISQRDAQRHHVRDKSVCTIRIHGQRGGVLQNVLIRVHPKFIRRVHLDTDEANALDIRSGMKAELLLRRR